METTTWRKLISEEMEMWHDHMNNVIAYAPKPPGWRRPNDVSCAKWMDLPFEYGYGAIDCPGFTLWTSWRVYFPMKRNGREWCASVPRYPCGDITPYVGGG